MEEDHVIYAIFKGKLHEFDCPSKRSENYAQHGFWIDQDMKVTIHEHKRKWFIPSSKVEIVEIRRD